MGSGTWSSSAYDNLKSSYTGKSTSAVFTNSTINADMSPKGVAFRESRDSDEHPETLAVAVFLDVTGSMYRIPEDLVRNRLGALIGTLVDHDIKDAQVLFGAVGDHISDNYPLQVGQFESETLKLTNWLTSAVLEGGGGGGGTESYLLPWYFGAKHTSIDCFEKRGQKGVFFTIGDETSHRKMTSDFIKEQMGVSEASDVTDKEILAELQKSYHVYHIHVNEGSYRDSSMVLDYWKDILPENLIICEDSTQIAELIATTVAMIHGIDIDIFTASFDSSTASSVKTALMTISGSITKNTTDNRVMTL